MLHLNCILLPEPMINTFCIFSFVLLVDHNPVKVYLSSLDSIKKI